MSTHDTTREAVELIVARLDTFVGFELTAQAAATLKALLEKVSQLEGALALGQENCDAAYDDLRDERDEAMRDRDDLRARLENTHNLLLLCDADRERFMSQRDAAQAREARMREALPNVIEFLEEVAIAEDRSNLDGDDADTVLSYLNDGAEEVLQQIRAALADGNDASAARVS